MKSRHAESGHRRPFNLSLDENVVRAARELTDNLSRTVEELLVDYVVQARAREAARAQAGRATAELWNAFSDRNGSFADEHSTL